MNRIKELIHVLEKSRVRSRAATAKANHRCKICAKPAMTFRTPQAKLEYHLSTICQSCQDYYLAD